MFYVTVGKYEPHNVALYSTLKKAIKEAQILVEDLYLDFHKEIEVHVTDEYGHIVW